jgi:sec-independent protein translocase protein TatA
MPSNHVDRDPHESDRTPWERCQAPTPLLPEEWVFGALAGLMVGLLISSFFHGHLGAQETIMLILLSVLLFGRKLPGVGRYLGKGIVEFKKGIKGLEDALAPPLRTPSRPLSRTEPRCATTAR